MDRRIYEKYVMQIVRDGGLTAAAVHLGVSQPALSAGISLLEKELGFKLFNRRAKPIALTPEGALYLEYLQKKQVLDEDFRKRLDGYRGDANNCAAIGGSVVYVETIVADAVAELLRNRPEYTISVCCGPLDELIARTAAGELNCFISTSAEIPDRFVRTYIKTEQLYLCVPAGLPVNEALKASQDTGDRESAFRALSGCGFIFQADGQPLQERLDSFLETYGVSPVRRAVTNQASAAISMAKRGVGICLASGDALRAANADGTIQAYPLPDAFAGRRIYAVYSQDLFMPTACSALLDCLADRNIKEKESESP